MHIVRVTKEEFEIADGSVFPIIPNLEEEISVEDFQKHYDNATEAVRRSQTIGGDPTNNKGLG